MAGTDVRFAAGVPNVGPFGDPLLLTDLAVAAEDSGWDAFIIWDHLLYRDPRWPAADPTVVIAAVHAQALRDLAVVPARVPVDQDLDDVDHVEGYPRHRASRPERPGWEECCTCPDGQVQPDTLALPMGNYVIGLGQGRGFPGYPPAVGG